MDYEESVRLLGTVVGRLQLIEDACSDLRREVNGVVQGMMKDEIEKQRQAELLSAKTKKAKAPQPQKELPKELPKEVVAKS